MPASRAYFRKTETKVLLSDMRRIHTYLENSSGPHATNAHVVCDEENHRECQKDDERQHDGAAQEVGTKLFEDVLDCRIDQVALQASLIFFFPDL